MPAISPGRWNASPQPQEESPWRKCRRPPAAPATTKHPATENREALDEAIREYVRVHQHRHGQGKTAESLGVSRHTLWRYLEHGHAGRAVPAAVLNKVGQNVRDIEAATLEIIIDLEGLRPDPALRPLRRSLEDALLLLCAAPLATVDELARFGRVPRPPCANGWTGSPNAAWRTRCPTTWASWGPARSAATFPRIRASPPPAPPPRAAGTC